MSPPSAEFVFFPLKPSVLPEEGTSEDGKAFLKALQNVKSTFGGMIWGRSVDKPEIMGTGVELFSTTTFPLDALVPFQASEPSTLAVHVNPVDLVGNPVTEIAIIPLDEDLSAGDKANTAKDAAAFGDALLAAEAPSGYSGRMALTYRYSWAEDMPKEHKNRLVMMIGWREVQNHIASTTTAVFKDNLKPITDIVAGELNVTHFKFKEVS